MKEIKLTYDELRFAVEKAVNKCKEMKWLTQNELITDTGLFGSIVGDISEYSRELQKNIEVGQAFETLQKYMPKVFQIVLEELHKEDKTVGVSKEDIGISKDVTGK